MQLLLFIFLPFVAFLRSCFNLRSRVSQVVFVLFFALFGYCHTFEDMRADSYRKHLSFTTYQAESVEEIAANFSNGEVKDVYESLLFSLLKCFTDNPHIMMMVVGLICGLFAMFIIRRITEDSLKSRTLPIIILIVMMVVELNPVLMGGIRNFTAFTLLFYSLIRLTLDNKRWWLIGILLTPLIHFGWVVASAAAIIAWLVRLPTRVLHYTALTVCVLSLFLDTSSYAGALDIVVGTMDNEAIADRVENYGDEEIEMEFNKSLTTRLLRINNQVGTCFVVVLLIYLGRRRKELFGDDYTAKIYSLLLWFTIVGYALISFSVVGQRFVGISMMLIYMLLLNLYKDKNSSGIRRFIYALPVVFVLHILWTLYNCYCNVGWEIFVLPTPVLLML
ncbi:MAG: EpsG family protein [Alistipes sp.]|nr:EpsG family protein [Alistipes sp.]